ncbi:hypothetical protein [Kitasatospora indigofera]|uniref:hypothetical protein n=1 Tax=Kitasatospora indigofera TaxID=67307 RepID=UPI0036BFF3D7
MLNLPPMCQATTQDPAEAGRLLATAQPCRADATHRVVGHALTTATLAAAHHELACAEHARQLAEQWNDRGVRAGGKRRPVIAKVHPYTPGGLYPTELQPALDGLPAYTPRQRSAAAPAGPKRRRTPPVRQAPLWTIAAQTAAATGAPLPAPTAGPDPVLPAFFRILTPRPATQDLWTIECSQHSPAWHTVRTVDGDQADAEDWAMHHALEHVQRSDLVTPFELDQALAADFSDAQAEIMGRASRGELEEDLNGFFVADGGNWKPKAFDARRVRTLMARGYLAWQADTAGYRRHIPLSTAGRAVWSMWCRARRCRLIDPPAEDTEAGVTDVRRSQYVMLREEFPAEREAANRRAKKEPAPGGGPLPLAVRTAVDWYHPVDAEHVLVRVRLVEYGDHRYAVRRAGEGEPMTLTRADGGPVLADGLRWWGEVERAVTEHAQAGGEGGRDALGPRPAIPWGLLIPCPVTIHQVGYRWRDVECSDCTKYASASDGQGPGLGEHDSEPAAVTAAVFHARRHEKEIREAMEQMLREDAVKALTPVFTRELYAILAAAGARADGLVFDGRRRYRLIPADAPATTERKGRAVRRDLVELLQHAGYLYARTGPGSVRPTPDGTLTVQAFAGVDLPGTWPMGKAPERLPVVPEGWTERRRRELQTARWEKLKAERADRPRPAAPGEREPAGSPTPSALV